MHLSIRLDECMRFNTKCEDSSDCFETEELRACLAIEGYRYCCKYRGPLSIISQSQCKDAVAHKHSRDFRMWCIMLCG